MTTMEDLTKTQIILLTLLVSFITSIATGIITASLLAEAPAGVTQTIDRVVEHTIERVAPAVATTPTPTTPTPVREVTVIREDNAVLSAIDTGSKSLVRIKSPANSSHPGFYALGAIVSKEGLVITDKRNVIANGIYAVTLADGLTLSAGVVAVSETDNLALMKLVPDVRHLTFTPLVLSDSDAKPGQTVVAIGGEAKNIIDVGRVTSNDAGTLSTSIAPNTETPGALLLGLSGSLAGIKSSKDDLSLNPGIYSSASLIQKFLTQNR